MLGPSSPTEALCGCRWVPERLGDQESDAILLSGEGWGVCMGVLASDIWLCFLARWEGERACPRVEVGNGTGDCLLDTAYIMLQFPQ